MFKNYLKVAMRNLTKYNKFSFINILGLAISMAAFLTIILYVHFEFSYDTFHENSNKVYRLQDDWYNEEGITDQWAYVPPAYGPAIKSEIPEVVSATRVLNSSSFSVIHKQEKLRCNQVMFVDHDFFKIFSFLLFHTNPQKALQAPNSVVISQRIADKIFAGQNPINQTLSFYSKRGQIDCVVTGVFENIPQNSHLQTDYFISYKSLISIRGKRIDESWYFSRVYTYLLLDGKNPPSLVESKIPALISKNREFKNSKISLQPLKDIHLKSDLTWDTKNGDAASVYLLLCISILIMIVAWINHVNISTANTVKRAKEVGIKKIVGASRANIGFQFFLEFIIQNTLAIISALVMLFLLTPVFSEMTGIDLFQAGRDLGWFSLVIIGLFVISILSSGLYPSLLFASHKPILMAKGKVTDITKSIRIRKVLMIAQFAASIILIAGTVVVYEQMDFINNHELGVKINDKIILRAPIINYSKDADQYTSQTFAFKNKVISIPGVESISSSYVVPGGNVPSLPVRRNDKSIVSHANINQVDYTFLPSYEVDFLAGRNFSQKYQTDEQGVIINDKLRQLLGYDSPEDALNGIVTVAGNKLHILGIVKDYHQLSLKKASLPIVFTFVEIGRWYYSIKINNMNQINEIHKKIETEWNRHFITDPFDSFYLEDHYNEQYSSEITFKNLFGIFCLISIVISCLGLFALSHYVIRVRTKEIGVRKVMGASVRNILTMLTSDFAKWVLLANIIAWPIAYYAMNKWLQNFMYRIELSAWPFLVAGTIALVIALFTVSFQAIKAATANPVEALRNE